MSARARFVVRGRQVACTAVLEPAAPARCVDDVEADVTFTIDPADLDGLATGRLDPTVAFMRGQMKTSGDPGVVLGALRACATAGCEEVWRCLTARAEAGG